MKPSSTVTYSITLPVSAESAFAYHARPGALRRLVPPWQPMQIESSDDSLTDGSRVVMRIRMAGVPIRWVAEHRGYSPPQSFEDVQIRGPFAAWHHRHLFRALSDSRCELTDTVSYRIPAGRLGQLVGGGRIRQQLDQMFAYRHAVTEEDLRLILRYPLAGMRIGVSGSHGLIGSQLCPLLSVLGHRVHRIVRQPSPAADDTIAAWADEPPLDQLRELDAVIHLAGKPIAARRWNEDVKQQILDSRVAKTRQLCERIARLKGGGPRVLLCASATGFYGDRADEVLTEASADGSGFLPEVARQWEEACRPAVDAGIRVVHLRFGIILSPQGGALAKLYTPARAGLGGPFGSGNQWWSWISLDDCLGAIYHSLANDAVQGAVNIVAPEPGRNHEFAKTLGGVLSRPALLPAPKSVLRLAVGEMADSLLLASARVVPERLQQTGYAFRFPTLQGSLEHLLGRRRLPA